MEKNIYTVSEITKYLKDLLAIDPLINDIWLTGEISNFHHHSSGHMYFTLKDENSAIAAIMFKGYNSQLKFQLEDGLKVIAHGYISLYEPRGTYQFYIDSMEPAGKGALYLAFEQLKEKLEKEGLFDQAHKKMIPLLPKKIGIVTSPTGAAIRDILSVVKRRFPNIYLLVVPSLVQGETASEQLAKGIEYLNRRGDIDLIILSRGGGTIEDLWPFNEEILARAIYDSQVPIISGVGHETDFTIADFVADLRAPTPSAAAELAIASRLELEKSIASNQERLSYAMGNKIREYRKQLQGLMERRVFTRPEELFSREMQELDDLSRRLEWVMEKELNGLQEKFQILNGKLESLSPLKTLARGYSISTYQGKVIDSIKTVEIGQEIQILVKDGEIKSRIVRKKPAGQEF
ncbi:MAG TPA: exodeoxyribonuclease VII large subunit [Halanaerobiaceae bacterium]|mgnify:FL=1|jgi:exodeoxyribonuclease VII large subunit|nr:exodeoxyribonuclease VII large subunit [Bacillota bacterium]HHU92928.1 exodeoxyribonuclease VII large subunit [Halanaerobiaceae bacterium]HOA41108.1 exodeoxyribonuclease VII large subunit [Halanaerobiales bacterium]HPZ63389.1 exodeoxyribonuclease VII large subunit [Halanaerobiales bacterium]HQD03929.1 exodeoxyribonuclease VII large subunit [Halanaerobiales bacterium]